MFAFRIDYNDEDKRDYRFQWFPLSPTLTRSAGSTPRHSKGLATCCHGKESHTVGWRFINERRAINLDPNCGWARGKADLLYVADAFAVRQKVNELLAKQPH